MSTRMFALDEDQDTFRGIVRRFAEQKIAPLAADSDRSGEFGWEAFEFLKSFELTALSFPVEYGGTGA